MSSPQISKRVFEYLTNLKQNNNREWFNEKKASYEAVKEEFEVFIDKLIPGIAGFDETISHHIAKKCIFRIYRDVRFSKDKSPYKTHLGAHITPAKNKSDTNAGAGYYIHIEPGASILAGGAYQPQALWLKNIREEIDYNSADFKKIIEADSFKKFFGSIEGEKLKRNPKGYANDHPEIELLKFKSFTAVHNLVDQQVLANDFLDHTIKVFKVLHPFNSFLNQALE